MKKVFLLGILLSLSATSCASLSKENAYYMPKGDGFTYHENTDELIEDSISSSQIVDVEIEEVALSNPTTPEAPKKIVEEYYYTGDTPFFDDYYETFEIDNNQSVDIYFDELNEINNTTNFCSLGTVTFDNINGKTVTVDAFSRYIDDSRNDPNFGQCMLFYQAIRYKIKHPTEDVTIDMSTYRFSITAAACLRRDSRFYGYMRSLYNGEYDSYGFVSLAFMIVEAAKMGINIIFTPQLNSYGGQVYQGGRLQTGDEPEFWKYFPYKLSNSCYEKYASGKVVSHYLMYARNTWKADNVATDMLHVKTCNVSHYTDFNDVDHDYGTFFESANFDAIDYLGRNANNGSQTGVIISGHEAIYRTTHNFILLMAEHAKAEQTYEFRTIVRDRCAEQISLFNQGRDNEIKKDEQLVYLGSTQDKVFQLYFTPLSGGIGTWDDNYNPYCYYIDKMAKSLDYIVFAWTVTYADSRNQFDITLDNRIANIFHKNKNIRNRIFLHVPNYGEGLYDDLVVGRDLSYKSINETIDFYLHTKDVFLSYVEGGKRQYITLLSSANAGIEELYYRTNSIVVIKEQEGNSPLFKAYGSRNTFGCI